MNSACTSGRVGWLAVAAAKDAALPERWPSGGGHGRHLGGQAQMAQVAGDVFGVLDQGDELHLSPATGAGLDVKAESPAHQLAPRDVLTAVGGRSRWGVSVGWQRVA